MANTSDITFEAELQNEHWETMSIEITKNSIDIGCPELGRVQMSHADFDALSTKVNEYRRACQEIPSIEIT